MSRGARMGNAGEIPTSTLDQTQAEAKTLPREVLSTKHLHSKTVSKGWAEGGVFSVHCCMLGICTCPALILI